MLIAFALLAGGAWWVYAIRERAKDVGPSSASAPTVATGPKTLLDVHERVTDDKWHAFPFELGNPRTVRLELDVTKGRGITAYVLDDVDYPRFQEVNERLSGGEFRHFPAFACEKKLQHHSHGELRAGSYVLVVKEGSNPQIIGKSDSAMVRIRLTAE